ncbi:MAG: helix-turn-helix domain-containing protein [Chloroflexi bacterium]|nr:helix-turn-helix domain-containing protein [Chloroflexota bacterium]
MSLTEGGFGVIELTTEKEAVDLAEYRDEGCEVFASCLSCPLPNCLEEDRGGKKRFLKQGRDEEILNHHERGKSTAEIARLVGVSRRTVQRVIAGEKTVASSQ